MHTSDYTVLLKCSLFSINDWCKLYDHSIIKFVHQVLSIIYELIIILFVGLYGSGLLNFRLNPAFSTRFCPPVGVAFLVTPIIAV